MLSLGFLLIWVLIFCISSSGHILEFCSCTSQQYLLQLREAVLDLVLGTLKLSWRTTTIMSRFVKTAENFMIASVKLLHYVISSTDRYTHACVCMHAHSCSHITRWLTAALQNCSDLFILSASQAKLLGKAVRIWGGDT